MKVVQLLILFFFIISCNSNDKRPLLGETKYQQELNATYKDASKSPLKKADLKKFSGLDFFPVDSSFIVEATFVKFENTVVFKMPTTTTRTPLYKEYGVVQFNLKGFDCELTVYQSQDNFASDTYQDYLFVPFTDHTSGKASYGGGRYMDVMISDIQSDGRIQLNFNNTYNPYCAYNTKYSCPLTPKKNHLDLEVTAGVKVFKKH